MRTIPFILSLVIILSACQSDNAHSSSEDSERMAIDYDTSLWQEVFAIPDKLILELKYATDQTPTHKSVYDCPRCFLTKEAAVGFHILLNKINEDGYIVKIWDCYRPKSIQSHLLDHAVDSGYVMNAMRGPMHVRGLAIDITLCDETGKEFDMGTDFDDLSEKASHIYMDLPPDVKDRRRYLLGVTREHGFQAIRNEWWHYNFRHSTAVMMDYKWSCN